MIDASYQNIRKAIFAGKFYPDSRIELHRLLEIFFNKNKAVSDKRKLHAIIAPHAGFPYSGETAAAAYTIIDPDTTISPIFIIGQSHSDVFEGASIWTEGSFETPLGQIPVNGAICKSLAANNVLSFAPKYHDNDHCIEVQLPFLQYKLYSGFDIVPILIGTKNRETIIEISNILKPYFEQGNLFVISTDLSHYPGYADAIRSDFKMTEAIQKNDAFHFIKTKEILEAKHLPGLQTSICSYGAVLSLLEMTHKDDRFQYEKMAYCNSATINNDYSKVVGYSSMVVRSAQSKGLRLTFTNKDKKQLLQIARGRIQNVVGISKEKTMILEEPSINLKLHTGAFVTIRKQDQLRGCIGTFGQNKALMDNVAEMAEACALRDPRFEPLEENELAQISIEISVLGPMQKVNDIREIVLGQHGIIVKQGSKTGTFLPHVAIEHHWTIEEMLGHCSQDKAGIGWDGWKDEGTQLYTYETYNFTENQIIE